MSDESACDNVYTGVTTTGGPPVEDYNATFDYGPSREEYNEMVRGLLFRIECLESKLGTAHVEVYTSYDNVNKVYPVKYSF